MPVGSQESATSAQTPNDGGLEGTVASSTGQTLVTAVIARLQRVLLKGLGKRPAAGYAVGHRFTVARERYLHHPFGTTPLHPNAAAWSRKILRF